MYIFVIDTLEYAGNFERDMTAYCTGMVGECEVGEEFAKEFCKEFPKQYKEFSLIVDYKSDEHGVSRPTEIMPTPGFLNDGVGNHYRKEDRNDPSVVKRYHKAGGKGKPGKYPAYQSVGIFMARKPDAKMVEFLMQRARSFAKVPDKWNPGRDRCHIIGFRLVQEETKTKTLVTYKSW